MELPDLCNEQVRKQFQTRGFADDWLKQLKPPENRSFQFLVLLLVAVVLGFANIALFFGESGTLASFRATEPSSSSS